MKRLTLWLAFTILSSSSFAFERWTEPGKSFICRGNHPRCQSSQGQYRYHQFGQQPGIGDFAGVSDQLLPGPPLIHYQTFLSELQSFRPNTNAVALWADAMARVDNSLVWGGFISARSLLKPGADAQLIGLEIDVLNDGKPGVFPNKSKVGLQIVGFGKQNTNAIEIVNQSPTSGAFSNGIVFGSTALAGDGAYLGATSAKPVSKGIDFQNVRFTEAAMLLGQQSAISFTNKSGNKSAIYTDDQNRLVLRAGANGLRIMDSTEEIALLDVDPSNFWNQAKFNIFLIAALIISALVNIFAFWSLIKFRRRLDFMSAQFSRKRQPALAT